MTKLFTAVYKQTAMRVAIACLILSFNLSVVASPAQKQGAAQKQSRAFKVEVTGSGRPMILIPGLSSAGEVWAGTVARYKSKYECHVLTLAGFAGEPSIEAPFLETVRLQLSAYIREKKLHKPVIVGHSLGGFLALWIASKEPDLIGALVIVDSLPYIAAAQIPNATVESMKPQAEAMRTGIASQSREQFEKFQPTMLKTMIRDEDKIALVAKWGLASDLKTIGQAMYEMFTIDLQQEIAAIKSPTLVIGTWIGLKQYATREAVEGVFKSQYTKLANYEFALSDKAMHFVMYDDPEWLFEKMDRFLATRMQASR
jgi:pimeloyl-ACP methyl ester carboxylesterase